MPYRAAILPIPAASSINLADIIPTQVIFASSQAVPYGLYARVFRHGSNVHLSAPAVSDHLIHFCLRGRTMVQGKIVRHFRPTPTEPGDLAVIPGGEPTEWQWTAAVDFLQFCLTPQLIADVALHTLDCDPARARLVEQFAIQDPLLREVGNALLTELQSGGRMGPTYIEALVHVFAVHLVSRYAERSTPILLNNGGLARSSLRLVTDYIHAHLRDELRLADVAALAHLSPFHFARLFKQATGRPVHQYIIEQRIEAAKQLLITSHLSISAVAAAVGFHDQSHFYRHFKRLTGRTPKQLREHSRNIH